MTNNGNLPAMPCEVVEQYHIDASQVPSGAPTLRERKVMSGGMTKREMMAMHILAGFLSDCEFDVTKQTAAEMAVEQADALLAELERTK